MLGDVRTLVVGTGLGRRHADAVVAFHPPAIGRMGLADIDHDERGAVLVPPVEFLDVPGLAAERPAGEVAEDQDDGLGADQLREGDLDLAVVGLEGEVGRGFVELRPRLERTDLAAEEAANEHRLRRPARARAGGSACRRRCERFLEVGKRQEALTTAIGRPEERLELLARDLAVAVAVGAREHERSGRGGQRAAREVEVGSGQGAVVVAVDASEVGVAAGELRPRDPAVAVAVEPLAGRGPVEPGLRHGRAEPAEIRTHRLVFENAGQHVDPLGMIGPGFVQGRDHLGRFPLVCLEWCGRRLLGVIGRHQRRRGTHQHDHDRAFPK